MSTYRTRPETAVPIYLSSTFGSPLLPGLQSDSAKSGLGRRPCMEQPVPLGLRTSPIGKQYSSMFHFIMENTRKSNGLIGSREAIKT
ncbi:hypothetical protein MRX96_046483 [Rhipicephalus microplus]